MSRCRTISCLGTNYICKIIAAAIIIFAVGELANALDMWCQARREG